MKILVRYRRGENRREAGRRRGENIAKEYQEFPAQESWRPRYKRDNVILGQGRNFRVFEFQTSGSVVAERISAEKKFADQHASDGSN